MIEQYIVEVTALFARPPLAFSVWRRTSRRVYLRPAGAVLEAVNAWVSTPENRPSVRIRRVGAPHPLRVWLGGPFLRLPDGTWRRIPQRRLQCIPASSKP